MRLAALALAGALLAPLAMHAQAPASQSRLEIRRYECIAAGTASAPRGGCATLKEPDRVVWPAPACSGYLNGPAAPEAVCVARGVPKKNGVFDEVDASCSDKEFHRAARECLRSHRLKEEFRGQTTPVCLGIRYRISRKSEFPTVVEYADCPPEGFTPTLTPAG